jgi:uncharacterized membrane protein
MNASRKSAAIILAGTALAILSPVSASAYSSQPLTFCNKSVLAASVAYGYYSPGVSDPADHSVLTGPFVSLGWWAVEPGACQTLTDPFDGRYIFWFAFDRRFTADQAASASPALPDHFCMGEHKFTFEDENASAEACTRSDGKWINVRKVDTWVNATVDFSGQ